MHSHAATSHHLNRIAPNIKFWMSLWYPRIGRGGELIQRLDITVEWGKEQSDNDKHVVGLYNRVSDYIKEKKDETEKIK